MLVQDLFENRMHDAYSVFQQLAGAVHNSEDIDLRVGHELMPLQSWQARYLLGQYKSIAKRQGPDAAMRFLADYNAITAALDAMDTRLGQMKRMPGSLPGQRAVDETHNHDEPEECYTCRGTGEGQFDGTSCSACGGSGIVRPTRDDDFDIPDDHDMREAALDPKHLQRYHAVDTGRWPDDSNSLADRTLEIPNIAAVRAGTAAPNKHFQSTPFRTNGAKVATKVKPSITKTTVDRLDRDTTVPNFLKKPMAREDARPGPLERSAPHTQKKTVDQLTHLQALNGLEETVNAMRAANRRISENLSLMAEAGSSAQQAAKAIAMKKAHKKPKTEAKATKTRLDPKCWTGKHIGTPATKVKGGVRVNNCVPNESVAEGVGETPQQQKVRAAISSGLAKSSQMDAPEQGVAEEGYGTHPSQRVDPRTGKRYVPPKSPLGKGMAEGLTDTQKKIEDTINKLEDRLKHAKTAEQWDRISARIERLQAGLKRSKQGVAEGKPQKKTDRYHINKDGKPATLASYPDKDSAVKDRDSKYPDAKVHQVGPRGKVKGEFEEGVAEDLKQPMKMADYEAQADRLHDEMMRYQHANDEAGYERAKQAYLALERQARQGMVPETAATMPPSPAAAAQAKAIVQKAADDRAVSLARMAGVVPNNVAEDSGAWPFQEINELSNDKLAQYKSAAGRSATAADQAGNYELGNKRFKGIVQATKKQFANDIAKHYDKAAQR